jgi:hypothetical protein
MQAIKSNRPRKHLLCIGLAAVFGMSAALAQVAAGTTGIDATGNYESEVQACRSGQTQQDTETCLREARNARADRSAGAASRSPENLTGNAVARCEALSGEDKAACQVRVLGYGSTSGSVAGGGVLTSVETVVVPAGATSVLIEPKTSSPVLLMPAPSR